MLGGLYGDLPPPSDDDKPSGNSSPVWSSSTKMAPPTLRKPPAFAPTQTILRPQNKPKPIPSQYKPPPPPPPSQSIANDAARSQPPALIGLTSSVIEEYDPARPNDYEEYRREKKRKAMEAEMKRELDKRRHEEEEKRERERELREKERERDRDQPPPPLNISGEEAWKRRAAMSGGGGKRRSSSPPAETSGQMTAAQRMMAKMGWKQGQGLGKSEQGITTPLVAKKTDRRAGVIVNASENKVKSVSISGEPTRVLLLTNMVSLSLSLFNFYICILDSLDLILVLGGLGTVCLNDRLLAFDVFFWLNTVTSKQFVGSMLDQQRPNLCLIECDGALENCLVKRELINGCFGDTFILLNYVEMKKALAFFLTRCWWSL